MNGEKGLSIELIPGEFSVYKTETVSDGLAEQEFCFVSKTDKEFSVMCESRFVPENVAEAEHGFKGFRVAGNLDFSLIGILSDISSLLAQEEISIFVISTFDTDYIFTKAGNFDRAIKKLCENGYSVENAEK